MVNTSIDEHQLRLSMTADDTAICELVTAVVVQAAMDFAEAYQLGLIKEGSCSVKSEAIVERLQNYYPERSPFPKWMEASDIYSASWFLFQSEALDEFIPACWPVSPDAVRRTIIAAAKSGKRINHF